MLMGQKRYWLLALLLLGFAVYFADVERLQARYFEYRASEEALEEAREEIAELQAVVEAARDRLQHYDSDPVNIEANVRQIKRRTHPDEIIFRVEFVPDGDDAPTDAAAGLPAAPQGGPDDAPAFPSIEHKDTGPN